MTEFCRFKSCEVYDQCVDKTRGMDIPFTIMEEMMQVLHTTTNFNIVKNSVHYDFDLNGVNLRNHYGELIRLSDHCRL